MEDLRDWIRKVEEKGELVRVEGADWDKEIGCLADLNLQTKKHPSALLFDNIRVYPAGYRRFKLLT